MGIGVIVYFIFFGPSAPHLTTTTAPFSDTSAGASSTTSQLPVNQIIGNAGTVVAPNLIEITTSPVAAGEVAFDIAPTVASTTTSLSTSTTTGSMVSTSATGADIEVHYIDRASGNVYAYRAMARSLTRISDKTLPGIQKATWLPGGSLAFVQFLADSADGTESLSTYALPADGTGGFFLQDGLDEVQVTGSTTVFTLAASTDNSIGTVMNADSTSPYQLFTSSLSSLIVYPAGNAFVAVTKAASEVNGYAFSINSKTSLFTPIIGPLRGLTILPSPSGQLVLYSYTDGTELHMNVLDLTSGVVTALPLATIAEKCVWTSDSTALYCAIPSSFQGNLPDDWYQGVVSFDDRIWRIDLSSHLATLVIDPHKLANVNIDAVNLTIDPQSQVLIFRDKKDSSLWAYSL
jgi:hypothetical protein